MVRGAALLFTLAALLAGAAPASAQFGFLSAWGTVGNDDGQFALPDGIGVDNAATVWVADRDNNRIERFIAGGHYVSFEAFRHRHRSGAPGRLNLPYDVAPDAIGNLYVADTHNDRIQEFSPTGELIRSWGSHGSGSGQFDQPRGIALDPFGNLWVADHENHRVQKFTSDGRFLGRFGANGGDGSWGLYPGDYNSPRGLSSDADGNIYVADDANNRIVKLSNDGEVLAVWGRSDNLPGSADGEFHLPYSTAVDRFGHLWVADTLNNRLVEMTTDGAVLARYGAAGGDGTSGGGPGEFKEPYDVAVDCAGNVYVSDKGNWRVQKFGDPSFGRPVCPPSVSVSDVRVVGRVVSGVVACDRPCRARVSVGQAHGVEQVLAAGGSVRVRVRVPRWLRPRVPASFEGSGAPGAVSSVRRAVTLPR